jgi:hypothetical protein
MALPPDINPDDYEIVSSERLLAEEVSRDTSEGDEPGDLPHREDREADIAEFDRLSSVLRRGRFGMAAVEVGDPDFAGEFSDESVLRALVSVLHVTPREYDHAAFLDRALEEYRRSLGSSG